MEQGDQAVVQVASPERIGNGPEDLGRAFKPEHFSEKFVDLDKVTRAFEHKPKGWLDQAAKLEESGLIGSSVFASKHKKAMKDKPLINFDCVSDGDHFLFVQSGRARKRCGAALAEAFTDKADTQVTLAGPLGAFYPSDQANFPCGVGVAALNRSPVLGLYMSRIHTAKDTVCREENFRFLLDGARRFLAAYKSN